MDTGIEYCEHCGQKMMVYRRSIRKNMLYMLRRLGLDFGFKAVKVRELDNRTVMESDFPKLRYWGLIHKIPETTSYRITQKGVDFILGRITVEKYKWIYNQQVQDDPLDQENPEIYCWEIVPEEISKEIVLEDALKYSDVKEGQLELV